VNKVLLTGRLTRDPEMRSLASGKNVTTFNSTFSTNVAYSGHGYPSRLPAQVAGYPRLPWRDVT